MELIVNRDDIYNGLLKTQSIIEKRSTMPILSNVLLDAKNDILRIKATDLEVGIDTLHKAKVIKSGNITVPGKKLFEIIKEIDMSELKLLKKDNNHLEIRSGKAVFNILSLPVDEFPSFPSYNDQDFFKLPTKMIYKMIEKTIYAVSIDELRHTLNGIYIEKVDSGLKMVATDGHRLSLISFSDSSLKDIRMVKGVIIPKKGAIELTKLLEGSEDELLLYIKDNNGVFRLGNTVILIRMIDGDFPDYKQVLPGKGDKEGRVNKELFLKALKRVSIFSSEKSRGVKLLFKEKQLEIFTANPDMGEASECIDMIFGGSEIEVGFNARYFIEILNSIDEEDVIIEIIDQFGPVRVKGINNEDHISIIMPMRL